MNPMLGSLLADHTWLQALGENEPGAAKLLSRPEEQQREHGYFYTIREICQQPATWIKTAEQMISCMPELRSFADGVKSIILTGSGSSEFAGHCVRPALRRELGIATEVFSGGALLTYGTDIISPERPLLAVSLARSGDSPESVGAILRLLESETSIRHLVLTCNHEGQVVDTFRDHPNVMVVALDDATNDRSLVMTSSFSNLLLAARSLGMFEAPQRYREVSLSMSRVAAKLLRAHFGTIARAAEANFRRAVFLGTGPRLGAARESALKMLEMTAGSVATLCDSYLGFRHGPMSFTHSDTLIVCYLSSDPALRAYECDLLREVNEKGLALLKVIVGENVPPDVARGNDVVLECPGLSALDDDDSAPIHVIVGQLLGFFCCLREGLSPDSPSKDGVINRVVQSFQLHLSSRAVKHGNNGEPN